MLERFYFFGRIGIFVVMVFLTNSFSLADSGSIVGIESEQSGHKAAYEWWYYNGIVDSDDGSRYGMHLLLFTMDNRSSYAGEFSVCDINHRTFQFKEAPQRLEFTAFTDRYFVKYGDWEAEGTEGGHRIKARSDSYAMDLLLKNSRAGSPHGDQSLFPMAEDGVHRYYSLVGMKAEGVLETPDGAKKVKGTFWHDHQWGSSDLSGLVSWNWLSIYLPDGESIMVGETVDAEGAVTLAAGSFIDENGAVLRVLGSTDIRSENLEHWVSPSTKTSYPLKRRIRVEKLGLEMELAPMVLDCEVAGSKRYWEGPVSVRGTRNGKPFISEGYQELVRRP